MSTGSPKPRLLVLTSTFPRWPNDPEPAFVFELSRRLTDAFEVTVLAPRAPGSVRRETMNGLRVIRFSYYFQRWEHLATHGGGILGRLRANRLNYLLVPLFLGGELWALVRLLRRERFDVIHAHWLIPQGLLAILARVLADRHPPLVCTSHGGDLFAMGSAFFRRLKRWIMDRCQALTVVSSPMRAMVLDMGVKQPRVEVMPMGVDLRYRFTPDPKVIRNSHELLFVGRLVEKKGLRVLLNALPKVLATHPKIQLTVAGSGPLQEELRRQTQNLGIAHRVDFLGMVTQSQLPALYRRATLLVAPFLIAESGDQEGLGLVLVESAGCGCPVIASNLPAIRDVITNEQTGYLVQPADVSGLANTIVQALSCRDAGRELAANAREYVVRRFDWEIVAARYATCCARIIDSKKLRRNEAC